VAVTYTFDVFMSLDGYGAAGGDWTGYWGKQGPELLKHRLELYSKDQRMVFGAKTYKLFTNMLAGSKDGDDVRDPWVTKMWNMPATVVSTTLNRALMAAGLVDRVQVTLFPVITGKTGKGPVFKGAADFDLQLIESRTLDGNIQELIYKPTLH
jgi:dihydrofolate reductase